MIQLTHNQQITLGVILMLIVLYFVGNSFMDKSPEELEKELKIKIEIMDKERKVKIKEMEDDIKFQSDCIHAYSGQLGTTKSILPCTHNILPQVNAMEHIQTENTKQISKTKHEQVKQIGTAKLLKKGDVYKSAVGGITLYAPFDGWRVNSAGIIKPYTNTKNAKELLESYGKIHLLPYFIEAQEKYLIDSDVLICIAFADSDLGKQLKSKNNIGNVGNNDRGHTKAFATARAGVLAIGATFHNKYLSHKQSIGSLSVGGGGTRPYYATSKENWNANVLNCLNTITDKKWDEHSVFRLPTGQP